MVVQPEHDPYCSLNSSKFCSIIANLLKSSDFWILKFNFENCRPNEFVIDGVHFWFLFKNRMIRTLIPKYFREHSHLKRVRRNVLRSKRVRYPQGYQIHFEALQIPSIELGCFSLPPLSISFAFELNDKTHLDPIIEPQWLRHLKNDQ